MFENADRTMATYLDSMEVFRESANEFMQHVHHLAEARAAFERATTASAELRASLDAGDETLRSLMTQLAHALDLHFSTPVLDKKNPESVKVEAMKASG